MPVIKDAALLQRRAFERLVGGTGQMELESPNQRPPGPGSTSTASGGDDAPIHYQGVLIASMSPIYPVSSPRTLTGVIAFCTFAGTTDTVFSVLVNGVAIAAGLVLEDGVLVSDLIAVPATVIAAASDYININVTTPGVGVVDFGVIRVWG